MADFEHLICFFVFFWIVREAALAADLIKASRLHLTKGIAIPTVFHKFCVILEAVIRSAASAASPEQNLKAVIKSAASAASSEFTGECPDNGLADGGRRTGRSSANSREAELAADLITAPRSLQARPAFTSMAH